MLNRFIKTSLVGFVALSLVSCAAPSAATEDDKEKAPAPVETESQPGTDEDVSEVISEASGMTSGPLTIVDGEKAGWVGSAEQDIAYKFERADGKSSYAVYVTDNGAFEESYEELQKLIDEQLVENSKNIYINSGWAEDKVEVHADTVEIDGKTFPAIIQHAESGSLIQDETDVLILKDGKIYVVATICGSPNNRHQQPSELFGQFKIDAEGLN